MALKGDEVILAKGHSPGGASVNHDVFAAIREDGNLLGILHVDARNEHAILRHFTHSKLDEVVHLLTKGLWPMQLMKIEH
eukprot:9384107-Ditylum_brightwellii.AAC.1